MQNEYDMYEQLFTKSLKDQSFKVTCEQCNVLWKKFLHRKDPSKYAKFDESQKVFNISVAVLRPADYITIDFNI